MEKIQNAVVTSIDCVMNVHSCKGRKFRMDGRTSFGLTLCISGQITYHMNGKDIVSERNTAILLPKGASYTLTCEQDGLFPLINFQCEGFACEEILAFSLREPQICIEQSHSIKKAKDSGKSRMNIFSKFYGLLNEIVSQSTEHYSLLTPVIQYIEQNLSEPGLSNQALADQLGISEVYLRKLFLRHLGTTPKQYVLALRLRKAKQLLTDTYFTISAIAEQCGFSNVYHFSREFKQKCGMTPTEFAMQNRIYEL